MATLSKGAKNTITTNKGNNKAAKAEQAETKVKTLDNLIEATFRSVSDDQAVCVFTQENLPNLSQSKANLKKKLALSVRSFSQYFKSFCKSYQAVQCIKALERQLKTVTDKKEREAIIADMRLIKSKAEFAQEIYDVMAQSKYDLLKLQKIVSNQNMDAILKANDEIFAKKRENFKPKQLKSGEMSVFKQFDRVWNESIFTSALYKAIAK